nr:uncharacterized protein LOC117281231 [Nicotiana tomentosiformis]
MGNRQAESSNKLILNIMKKKLGDAKGLWPKVLLEVLWAYRTTSKMSTGETPYSLVYRTEAVIPVEVGVPSLRCSHESGTSNDEGRRQELDEVNERRDMAYIRMIAQKQQAERYYNKKAKVMPLKVRDYVLKAKTQASKDPREDRPMKGLDRPGLGLERQPTPKICKFLQVLRYETKMAAQAVEPFQPLKRPPSLRGGSCLSSDLQSSPPVYPLLPSP